MLQYLTALFVLFDGEKKVVDFFGGKKVHPGDLAEGSSEVEMTWLLYYCAGAATGSCLAIVVLEVTLT